MLTNAHTLPRYPGLTEKLISDVVVIGGGMAGILTAYTLHQAGVRVVLLEEKRLASGVTARTTARITAQHGLFCERFIRSFGEKLARQYLMAQLHAVRQYRELAAALGIRCHMSEQTSHICASPNVPDLSREYVSALLLGAPAELRPVRSLPFPVGQALCFTGQACFEPLPFLQALLPGLVIYENSPVRDIRGHRVYCDNGCVEASHIVVATRYPLLERRGNYRARLCQEQQYLLALTGTPPLNGWYLEADSHGWGLQQWGHQLIVSGGLHRCGENPGNSFERLRAFAKRWFPNGREIRAWTSQDCVSIDRIPFIGRYSMTTPHLHVAAGFGRWGMTNSMVAASLLTAEIMEKHYPYADIFSPSRLFPSASAESAAESVIYTIQGKARRLFASAKRSAEAIEPGHGGFIRRRGKLYGVYHDNNGHYFAVDPICPHRGSALVWNDEEKTWDCPCHGSRFDCTGRQLFHPARADLMCRQMMQ